MIEPLPLEELPSDRALEFRELALDFGCHPLGFFYGDHIDQNDAQIVPQRHPAALLRYPARKNRFRVRTERFVVNRVATYMKEGLDYLDMDAYVDDPAKLRSFRGVSGGGLWNVKFYVDPAKDEPAWIWSLEGLAFFEFPIQGQSAIIRCRGPNSIDAAIIEP